MLGWVSLEAFRGQTLSTARVTPLCTPGPAWRFVTGTLHHLPCPLTSAPPSGPSCSPHPHWGKLECSQKGRWSLRCRGARTHIAVSRDPADISHAAKRHLAGSQTQAAETGEGLSRKAAVPAHRWCVLSEPTLYSPEQHSRAEQPW